MTPDAYLIPLVSALIVWIWWVDRKVASHETIILKMDKLLDLLVERGYQDAIRRGATEERLRESQDGT